MALYACGRCGAVFANDDGCRVCGYDEMEAVEDDEYVCDECGEPFDSQQGLSSHSRVHKDDDE